jgi:tetraacyldisaccharide 4'-kinase
VANAALPAGILDRGIPLFQAKLAPDGGCIAALGSGPVLAFAGIGDPEKFFATLRDAGITVAATRSFPDHHRYTRAEAVALCEQADREGLILVTTEKDVARMRGDDAVAQLVFHANAFPVTLVFDDTAAFNALLLERIAKARRAGGSATA